MSTGFDLAIEEDSDGLAEQIRDSELCSAFLDRLNFDVGAVARRIRNDARHRDFPIGII